MRRADIWVGAYVSLIVTGGPALQATYAQAPDATQPTGRQTQEHPVTFAANLEKFQSVPFEGINGNEPDKLSVPRLMAAAVVAQFKPDPYNIADVGAFQGEFLEAFMVRFPKAHGLWTDAVSGPEAFARKRLARFGDRVTYKVACLDGDISDGCIPKYTDVIIASWVTMHQPIQGITKFYEDAHKQLPSGGWLIILDHVGFSADSPWEGPLKRAQTEFHAKAEGPRPFVKTRVPTYSEEMKAFEVAGFDDVQVVWRSFTDALFMARKR